jgi:hypothetical protein
VKLQRDRHTDGAVQANNAEDISSAALGVAIESSGAEAGSSGSERSGSSAGSEGEDGVTHLCCYLWLMACERQIQWNRK